jgi:hypothetical protein
MDAAARELLDLHRALVAAEREEYERPRGRLADQKFLEALLNDPDLRWLAPFTALVARLDGPAQADVLPEIRALLKPDPEGVEFQRRYAEALQRSADVAVAHGRAVSALRGNAIRAGR